MIGDRFKKIRGCCNLVILVRLIIFDPLDQKNMRCTIEKAAGSDSMFIFSIHILEGKTLTMVWSCVCLYLQCICTFWYIFWWCYFCLYFQCICTFLSICICVLFRSTLTTRTVRKPRWSLGRIALVSGRCQQPTPHGNCWKSPLNHILKYLPNHVFGCVFLVHVCQQSQTASSIDRPSEK